MLFFCLLTQRQEREGDYSSEGREEEEIHEHKHDCTIAKFVVLKLNVINFVYSSLNRDKSAECKSCNMLRDDVTRHDSDQTFGPLLIFKRS